VLLTLTFLSVLAPMAVAGARDTATRSAAVRADHVVLVALDGFDADYLRRGVPTPNLDALADRGSLTTSTGVMTSITNPSWAAIATGAFPRRTRTDAYRYDRDQRRVVGQSQRIAVETIGQSLRSAGRTLASIQWFIERGRSVSYGNPTALYTQPDGPCGTRVDQAVALIRGEPVDSAGSLVAVPQMPALLAVYCNDLDAVGHEFGADAPIVGTTLAAVDADVGRLVRAVDDAGLRDRTTFVLTGDHGMTTVRKAFGGKLLAAIGKAGYRGELVATNARPARGTDVVLAAGGVASLHLRGEARSDPRAVRKIAARLRRLPQVAKVLDKDRQKELRMSAAMGDLVIEPRQGWSVERVVTDAGQHGTTREMAVPLLLAGAGIRPGRDPEQPRHVDIAPTIARLLGERAPSGAQGRVLLEALT